MLRPTAVQSTLKALLESSSVSADTALVVFSDSGTIYAQAFSQDASQIASSSSSQEEPRPKMTESQRLQFARQPGLSSLLGNPKPRSSKQRAAPPFDESIEKGNTATGATAMELPLESDERSKILAALACQSWLEETNRVKRLFTKIHGHTSVAMSDASDRIRSFSASTGGGGAGGSGSGKNGHLKVRRVEQNGMHRSDAGLDSREDNLEKSTGEQDSKQEYVEAPVAVPGTLLNVGTATQSVAPLLLEGELGALLIMPLHHQAITPTSSSPSLPSTSSPLLLVLSARPPRGENGDIAKTGPGSGSSLLSQQQWNDLNDAANAFAIHVTPSLRKAFGREERGTVGDTATLSDIESSVDLEGIAAAAGQEGADQGQVVGSGISVR